MSDYGPPILFALFVWWFSTGLVLILVRRPASTFRWSLAAASALLALSLHGLVLTSGDTSPAGAYVAFTLAILVWAWPEMTFLMGLITGPRRERLQPGATGWRRFQQARRTVMHHEYALVVVGLAIVAVTWGGANQVAVWTFALLWTMRLSAKLNLFLGVRTPDDDVLPSRLRYLKSYFADRPINLLFPISITGASVAAVLLAQRALSPDAGAFEATAFTLLATLAALAVLEHWFMVLPLPGAALWTWSLRDRSATADPNGASHDEEPHVAALARGANEGRLQAAFASGPAAGGAPAPSALASNSHPLPAPSQLWRRS